MKKVLLVLAMVALTFGMNAQKVTKTVDIFNNYQGKLIQSTDFEEGEEDSTVFMFLRQDRRYSTIVSRESFFYGETIEEFKEHMNALEKFSLENSKGTSSEINGYRVQIYKVGQIIVSGKDNTRAYTLFRKSDFKKIKQNLAKKGL